jgi:hypothetical protein
MSELSDWAFQEYYSESQETNSSINSLIALTSITVILAAGILGFLVPRSTLFSNGADGNQVAQDLVTLCKFYTSAGYDIDIDLKSRPCGNDVGADLNRICKIFADSGQDLSTLKTQVCGRSPGLPLIVWWIAPLPIIGMGGWILLTGSDSLVRRRYLKRLEVLIWDETEQPLPKQRTHDQKAHESKGILIPSGAHRLQSLTARRQDEFDAVAGLEPDLPAFRLAWWILVGGCAIFYLANATLVAVAMLQAISSARTPADWMGTGIAVAVYSAGLLMLLIVMIILIARPQEILRKVDKAAWRKNAPKPPPQNTPPP